MHKIKFYIFFLLVFLIHVCYPQDHDNNKKLENQIGYAVDDLIDGEFLHDFMMIGPFPNHLPDGVIDYFHLEETCLGFSKDYLLSAGGEKNTLPFIGQEVSFGNDQKLIWQKTHSVTDKINLKKIFTPNDKVIAYAAIYIDSDRIQEKLMGIGSNDGMKVWLNGEKLIKVHKPRTVNIDDEYLKLNLKKGKNLLLIKIEQGFGSWGFILRPVDSKTAWKQVQKRIDVSMNSEFKVDGEIISGTIGDNNIVGQLSGLPMAKVEFKSNEGKHTKTMHVPVGTKLKLKKSDFPAKEYAINISFDTEAGMHTSYAYMNTVGDIVKETREIMYKDLPDAPVSPMANYYKDFIHTVKWLDKANKLWEHPYGYRRYLDGIKKAHRGSIDLQKSNNPFDGVFPEIRSVKFYKKELQVTADWQIFDPNRSNDYIEKKLNKFWINKFSQEPIYSKDKTVKKLIILELSDSKKLGEIDGSYLIYIEKDKVFVKAKSRQGLFYGLSTLLQALEQNTSILTGVINDSPSFPVRSVVVTKTKSILSDDFKTYIKKLADLRYNVAYLPSNNYLHLEDKAQLKEMQEVFAYCKSHFIEPVPYIETFGGGTLTRVLDDCLDEGIFHKNEPWTPPNTGLIELDVPRILDCQNSTIHVKTKEGKELKRYIDYIVLSSKNPKILIQNSNLFNTELFLSYDAVDFSSFPHAASCPSDPHGWEIQEQVISTILTKLNPKSIQISQDEVGLLNKDSRCLMRGLTNQEIMIDQINRVYNIIRKYDKDVAIYMWGDMFNDFQNAPKIGAKGSVKGLPNDIGIHDWNYIGVYHSDKMLTVNQMNFYLDKGFKTGGVAWFEPANVLDILQTGKEQPNLFLGIMHSAWATFEYSLLPVAEANWTGKSILGNLKF